VVESRGVNFTTNPKAGGQVTTNVYWTHARLTHRGTCYGTFMPDPTNTNQSWEYSPYQTVEIDQILKMFCD
jgi:hypothetical protein